MRFIKMYQAQDISLLTDSQERKQKMEELEADKARGATLGSQISQDMALVIPNDVDHFIKDKMRVKHNIRYMDDGNIIHDSKHFLKNLQEAVGDRFAEIGLTLNPKKTCIVKATKGFMFLKVFYRVTNTGKIVKKIAKSGIIRMRRKLKKFRRLVDKGVMRLDDVFNSFKSWWGTARDIAQTYRQRKRMLNLYNRLFHQYRTRGMVA